MYRATAEAASSSATSSSTVNNSTRSLREADSAWMKNASTTIAAEMASETVTAGCTRRAVDQSSAIPSSASPPKRITRAACTVTRKLIDGSATSTAPRAG